MLRVVSQSSFQNQFHNSEIELGIMDMIRAIHFLISLLAYAMGMGSLALFILFVGGWTCSTVGDRW